jgi:excisionase family DNA binding protein
MEKDSVPIQIPGQIQARDSLFDNRLLNYSEAAEYLCVSESYLRRLKSQKQIAYVPMGNRGVRFRVASLNRWIERREMT